MKVFSAAQSVAQLDAPKLRRFKVTTGHGEELLASVCSLPWVARLEEFDFRATSATPIDISQLVRFAHVASRIKRLRLDAPFTGEVASMFRRELWPNLEELDLAGASPDLVDVLSSSDILSGLSRLRITGPAGPPTAGPLLRALAEGSRLDDLELDGLRWDRAAGAAYFDSGCAGGLQRIRFNWPYLLTETAAWLLDPAKFPEVRAVDLPCISGEHAQQWGGRCRQFWER